MIIICHTYLLIKNGEEQKWSSHGRTSRTVGAPPVYCLLFLSLSVSYSSLPPFIPFPLSSLPSPSSCLSSLSLSLPLSLFLSLSLFCLSLSVSLSLSLSLFPFAAYFPQSLFNYTLLTCEESILTSSSCLLFELPIVLTVVLDIYCK